MCTKKIQTDSYGTLLNLEAKAVLFTQSSSVGFGTLALEIVDGTFGKLAIA